MSSRSLADLSPVFRPYADSFLAHCESIKLDVLVYCTLRTQAEQATLYAQGRTTPGPIVTDAMPGQSAHNYGLAFDGVPMINGKPAWDEPISGPHWQLYGTAATAAGVTWAGTWIRFRELPHIEMVDWQKYIPKANA